MITGRSIRLRKDLIPRSLWSLLTTVALESTCLRWNLKHLICRSYLKTLLRLVLDTSYSFDISDRLLWGFLFNFFLTFSTRARVLTGLSLGFLGWSSMLLVVLNRLMMSWTVDLASISLKAMSRSLSPFWWREIIFSRSALSIAISVFTFWYRQKFKQKPQTYWPIT